MTNRDSDLAKIVTDEENPPGKKYKSDPSEQHEGTSEETVPIAQHAEGGESGANDGTALVSIGDSQTGIMQFEVSYPLVEDNMDEEGGPRAEWGNQVEFLLTCVGYAVGLGNVWRFPYLCYKNGGGAFLFPYCIMLVVVGLPCFFMELSFGQFASVGPLTIWRISPLFKGLGISMVMVSLILSVYYNVVVSQCLFFLVASMQSKVPWSECGHSWNSWRCRKYRPENLSHTENATFGNATGLVTTFLSDNCSFKSNDSALKCRTPAEEFYEDYVLKITDGIDHVGEFNWLLTLSLFMAWVIVTIVLIKGIQSLGKVSYFTATFPYIMLTILLVRGATLPGALMGVKYYVTPQWARLLDYKVWMEAATMIFFNLSCCNGGLIAMSSYNKFKHNCHRDAIFVAVVNAMTSVLAGFVIFCNLGFMAHQKQLPVDQVAKGGPGLAFIVYPEALTHLPLTPLWSVLFFIMMATLGFGSQFSIAETVLSAVQDELRANCCGRKTTRSSDVMISEPGCWTNSKLQVLGLRIGICFSLFLMGLSMMYGGGMYLLNLVDNAVSTFPLLVCGFMEIVVLMYIYGYRHFCADIHMMLDNSDTSGRGSVSLYWRATWLVITPVILFGLIFMMAIFNEPVTYDHYVYSRPFQILAILIGVFIVMWIPVYYIYKYCLEGGFVLLKEFHKPAENWGPAARGDRESFLENLTKRTDSQEGTNMFFQSKLSVAAELQRAHSKESGMNQLRSHTNSFSVQHQSAVYDPQAIASAANSQQQSQLLQPPPPPPPPYQQPQPPTAFTIGLPSEKTNEDIQTTV